VGIDPKTNQLAGSTIQEQTRQALINCENILRAADAELDDVVEVHVLLARPNDFAGLNEEYAKFFPTDPPTRVHRGVPMIYRLGADLVLIVHLGFVLFVVLGGLLVWRWTWLIWVHLAAVFWGALIEFAGFVCPLTPLEGDLRELGGKARYEGDFVGHYITEFLYPSGLTRPLQFWLGTWVLLLNFLIYGYFLVRKPH
jgi:hypothetical protein